MQYELSPMQLVVTSCLFNKNVKMALKCVRMICSKKKKKCCEGLGRGFSLLRKRLKVLVIIIILIIIIIIIILIIIMVFKTIIRLHMTPVGVHRVKQGIIFKITDPCSL